MNCICGNGSVCFCGTTAVNPTRENVAPPSELVKAAEEALWYLSLDVNKPQRGQNIEENLRAALDKVKS